MQRLARSHSVLNSSVQPARKESAVPSVFHWEWLPNGCYGLTEIAEANPKAKPALIRWLKLVKAAKWGSMNEVQVTVPGVVVLNGERARFEIAGGSYRLIVSFSFKYQIAFIKFIGTHAEYDKVDALTVAMY